MDSFTKVYTPPDGTRTSAHIIIVPEQTWNPPYYWLQDALKDDLASWEIFKFSHTNKTHENSPDYSKITARALIIGLSQLHRPGLPIVFLAEGWGGIIVKQALISLQSSPYGKLSQALGAIVFFETAHRGIPVRQKLIQRGHNSQETFMSYSEYLREVDDSFRTSLTICKKYKVISIYGPERLYFPGDDKRNLITKKIATLSYPGEVFIAKNFESSAVMDFPSRRDGSYLKLVGYLRNFEDHWQSVSSSAPQISGPEFQDGSLTSVLNIYAYNVDLRGCARSEFSIADAMKCHQSDAQGEEKDLWLKTILKDFVTSPSDVENAEWPPNENHEVLWIHVPVNNTSWASSCLQSLSRNLSLKIPGALESNWISNERKNRSDMPHSRFIIPSHQMDHEGTGMQFALYLPYLNWDTQKGFEDYSKSLKEIHEGEKATSYSPSGTKGLFDVLDTDRKYASSYHPRRSLDQYFYSNLNNTTTRDQDQVVSRQTDQCPSGRKMIIVDQLWVWVWCTSISKPITMFTNFPERAKKDETDTLHPIAGIRQAVLDQIDWSDKENLSTWDVVGFVIENAISAMLDVRTEESLRFFELFREAIGSAAEAQTQFFREFEDNLKRPDSGVTALGQKHKEVQLTLELADIIDELNTLSQLLETQSDTLKSAWRKIDTFEKQYRQEHGPGKPPFRAIGGLNRLSTKLAHLVEIVLEDYSVQVKRMTRDAQRIHQSLLSLLDLQQKEANLFEARSSNQQALLATILATASAEQADETRAQSQIILLFTIITIIFLPLSFFTSYFGMNVTELTGEEGNLSHARVWSFMGPLSFTIIGTLLGTAYMLYTVEKKRSRQKWVEKKERLKRRGLDLDLDDKLKTKKTETV